MATTTSDASNSFPAITGYEITERLHDGAQATVYRGVSSSQQQSVVIKVMRQRHPSVSELARFRNQYDIVSSLTGERAKKYAMTGVVRSLGLEPYQNGYVFVMEDFGGRSLRQAMQAQPLTLIETLAVGVQLAETLHDLCQHRIVHKNIQPAHILIHPDSKQVKLIDFGIASRLPMEIQESQHPNRLEGTLAYMAPEQTGRVNRGIDYRTDFYGLGVTLYELLTGQLPFLSTDPLALIHAHITHLPKAPHLIKRDIPSVISQLILKLMAKNAEDRYQSALGLKFDLEQCLVQLKDTGKIVDFELGQQDVRDLFLIPEKLYGREREIQSVLEAFERSCQGSAELILVAGTSGIGKTAFVQEIHQPMTCQQGYFVQGKFDQLNRDIPLSGFVQALRELMKQLMTESDSQLGQWRQQILDVVGESGQLLIELIPELESIIGPQPKVPELTGIAAKNRFYRLFHSFIGVFATPAHPFVIFLDDLQWADSISLQLIKLLVVEQQYLLLMGAYRDNEVSATHALSILADDLTRLEISVNTLTLQPLTVADTHKLVADTVHCVDVRSQLLAELIHRKTEGNPFFVKQLLKSLYHSGDIFFDHELRAWETNLNSIKTRTLTEDVVTLMVQQLEQLPQDTQQALKFAACIGNQFDLETLALITVQTPSMTATALWPALERGLLLPISQRYQAYKPLESDAGEVDAGEADAGPLANQAEAVSTKIASPEITYRFLHDRVQQAAYALLTENQRPAIHLKIGQLLQTKLRRTPDNSNLFLVVNHLNQGMALIEESLEESSLIGDRPTVPDASRSIGSNLANLATTRQELLQLNVLAGNRANASAAYIAAFSYLKVACHLLPENSWQQNYTLTKETYTAAANNAYLAGDFSHMETWIAEALACTQTFLDEIPFYEIQLQALVAQHQLPEAIQLGLNILQKLGIHLPAQPTAEDIGKGLQDLQQQMAGRPVSALSELPHMCDPTAQASMRILLRLSAVLVMTVPQLMPLAIFKMVSLSIQEGNTALSALAYATYGMILCSAAGELDTGYEFGELALTITEILPSKVVQAKTLARFHAGVGHWRTSLGSSLAPLKAIYHIALDSGDLEYAAISAQIYAYTAYFSGQPLSQLAKEIGHYSQAVAQLNQPSFLYCIQIYHQHVLNLLGETEQPCQLIGSAYNETTDFLHQVEAKDAHGIAVFHLFKAIGYYLFGAYDDAQAHLLQVEPVHQSIASFETGCGFYFYDSLACLATFSQLPLVEQPPVLARIRRNQEKLKAWAKAAPMNYQHKYQLVAAEEHRIANRKLAALELYDQAIASAHTYHYRQDAALANELAAKFCLEWGKENIAKAYIQAAYYGYQYWGATTKVAALVNAYPQLLPPSPEDKPHTITVFETLAKTVVAPGVTAPTTTTTTTTTTTRKRFSEGTSTSVDVDLMAVLKASQNLSGTIHLDDLLHQLTQVILQNSGGDRCALILPDQTGTWYVKAIATPDRSTLCTEALESHTQLPVKLLQYVKRTRETVVINDLETDLPVFDEYLTKRQPKSVLGLPILNQGHLLGILYLNHRSASHVFTSERILILNVLCWQAAISLENARLYQTAHTYAQQLEDSQLQTIQTEKMASLGNLVAGVAHEINNPLSFLEGSLENTQEYIQDLLGHVDVYQSEYPAPTDAVKSSETTIELDFVRKDLPTLITTMQQATERIHTISTSLRTFSRADTENKVNADLNEGLESTLLILKYRLKANKHRPGITVVKSLGDLPLVTCFPGQLNQVFMNLLANAIDVFDEAAQSVSFTELEERPQVITVTTRIEQDWVEILIHDNGKGISKDIQKRIFDHLFTTKTVGKGTGLGLAIAQKIIVETHGGTLDVQSELGQGTTFCVRLPLQ